MLLLFVQELTIIVSRERCQPDIVLPVACMRPETLSDGRAELLRSVTLLHLISAICEAFEMQCLSSTKHIFLFIKVGNTLLLIWLHFLLVLYLQIGYEISGQFLPTNAMHCSLF